MRFKLVPEPPDDLDTVETIHRAVPLVPGTEDDCCARIQRRTDVSARDVARTWLTFLRALELVREGPSGFSRIRADPDREQLCRAFRENVYGVEVVREILEEAAGSLSEAAVYERFAEHVPQYERHRYGDRVDEIWRERVERILAWGALLGRFDREDGGYVVPH